MTEPPGLSRRERRQLKFYKGLAREEILAIDAAIPRNGTTQVQRNVGNAVLPGVGDGRLVLELPPQAAAEVSDAAHAARIRQICDYAGTDVRIVEVVAPGAAVPSGWVDIC